MCSQGERIQGKGRIRDDSKTGKHGAGPPREQLSWSASQDSGIVALGDNTWKGKLESGHKHHEHQSKELRIDSRILGAQSKVISAGGQHDQSFIINQCNNI